MYRRLRLHLCNQAMLIWSDWAVYVSFDCKVRLALAENMLLTAMQAGDDIDNSGQNAPVTPPPEDQSTTIAQVGWL